MDKTTTGITALIIGVIATAGVAFAFGGGFFGNENKEAIRAAIESNDYDAWKEAMGKTLTEERFNRLVEMHEKREAVTQALKNGDYETWKQAVENLERPRITELITEENFDTFIQLYEAKMSGDYETVKELSEEIGFEIGPCGHRMFGKMGGMMGGKFL